MRRQCLGSTLSNLNGNSFSSLAAAETKDPSAALGGASFSEAVNAGSVNFAGLPGAFGHIDLVIVPHSSCFGFFGS